MGASVVISAAARPRVLMLLGSTIAQKRRSGIHRVAVEAARGLAVEADLDIVRWDALEGRLRFIDASELDLLFGPGAWPQGVRVRPAARAVGRPFFETFGQDRPGWLLIPEVAWHEAHGAEMLARVITACREAGVRTAAVFYDLIPILNAVYSGGKALHEAYVAELVRCDLLLPISRHSGEQLLDYWRRADVTPPPVEPVLLPDGGWRDGAAAALRPSPDSKTIALIGTVEPRKRQIEFLAAMAAARRRSPRAAERNVVLIGSLHPYVADAFNAFAALHPWVRYLDYASDADLRSTIADADFTAFASDDEGYGLPISESLALGAPCLCANFGAMAEIAEGGGCLTVDVRDAAALEEAIVSLCDNPQHLARLRDEIACRRFRDWRDYSRDILDHMDAAAATTQLAPVSVCEAGEVPAIDHDAHAFRRWAEADILSFPGERARADFVEEAERRGWPELLPAHMPLGDASRPAANFAATRGEQQRVASVERSYARARHRVAGPTRPIFLRILISTYNRRDFVVANARWLLSDVIRGEDADLVIVDGGSSDGTVRALTSIRDPRLRVVQSPVNVGMLSGIREASRLLGAEYVWVIGDDDYIRPEAFAEVLAALRAHAGIGFGFTNFSVYHRAALDPADRVGDLIAESRPVAEATAPDGLVTVREAAEQTDNLFTAIYTIIWRADLLAAAFDHAFDGEPFSSLTEAAPCTELILRRYAACDAWWRSRPAIAGNAHNSWSRWRPRWHGVVMPLAFALARDAGVDRSKLQAWARMHGELFDEAMDIARETGIDPGLDASALRLGERLYRRSLSSGA